MLPPVPNVQSNKKTDLICESRRGLLSINSRSPNPLHSVFSYSLLIKFCIEFTMRKRAKPIKKNKSNTFVNRSKTSFKIQYKSKFRNYKNSFELE